MPIERAVFYGLAAFFLSLAQGLGMNAIGANINQIQGSFGVTVTEATWLMAAYMAPNASLSLILVKVRTQYGIRRFAELSILLFVLVSAVHLYVNEFGSALVLRFFAGAAASPMSSLGFLYMLEIFQPARKMNLGLCLTLANMSIAAPVARLISPALLDLGQWHAIYMVEVGLSLIALVLVYLLPLTSPPRAKVITALDLISYLFIAVGFGCLAVVLTVGRLYWWLEAPWIGVLMVVAVISLTVAAVIELNRASPLVDIKWLASGPVLHFAAALLLLRLLLSEQSAGAIPFMTQLGLSPAQTSSIWAAILIASIAAGLACAAIMKPGREPAIHAVALVLVGIGAWLDAQSTNLTRPEQMLLSQTLIAVGAGIYLPPAVSSGITMAFKKGPNYIMSFIVIFLTTQSLGGLMGSALMGSFVTIREKFHSARLVEQFMLTDPLIAQRAAQLSAAYGKVIQDKTLLNAEGLALLSQQATREAYVLAYNDLFLLTAALCAAALGILVIHMCIDAFRSTLVPAQPQT
ncbi:MFS transporter [Rhizobium sp.]